MNPYVTFQSVVESATNREYRAAAYCMAACREDLVKWVTGVSKDDKELMSALLTTLITHRDTLGF